MKDGKRKKDNMVEKLCKGIKECHSPYHYDVCDTRLF